MRYFLLVVYLIVTTTVFSQTDLQKVRSYRQTNEASIYNDFISFLKIPNVATDTLNIRKNADFLLQFMKGKGISNVRLLEGNDRFVPPVVFGEVLVPGATKTVIFYAH